MADPQVVITGIDSVSARLMELVHQFPVQAAQALNEVGEETMTQAKEFTPVEHGPLRNSGHVIAAEPDKLDADLRFATEYAAAVHEHMSEHSPPSWVAAEAAGRPVKFHPAGTGPKFLERAIQNTARDFEERIAKKIRSRLLG